MMMVVHRTHSGPFEDGGGGLCAALALLLVSARVSGKRPGHWRVFGVFFGRRLAVSHSAEFLEKSQCLGNRVMIFRKGRICRERGGGKDVWGLP